MTITELKLSVAPKAAAMLSDVTADYDAIIASGCPDGALSRFEALDAEDPNAPLWRGGTISWCADVASALLFQGYEQAAGHRTMLLWDMIWSETGGPGAAVVSTRPGPFSQSGAAARPQCTASRA